MIKKIVVGAYYIGKNGRSVACVKNIGYETVSFDLFQMNGKKLYEDSASLGSFCHWAYQRVKPKSEKCDAETNPI